jgi:hypothetical protein
MPTNPNVLPIVRSSAQKSGSRWREALTNVRNEINTALDYSRTIGSFSSLIALAGLLYWCPRCGQWMGEGSEGKGPNIPSPEAKPQPRRLLRAVGRPLLGGPTPVSEMPRQHQNRLTREGVLKQPTKFKGVAARVSYDPPSSAHGRVADTYYGGRPKADSRPHGHHVEFIRGDEERTPIYDRLKDGTPVFDSGTDVTYIREDNTYEWRPKQSYEGESNQ